MRRKQLKKSYVWTRICHDNSDYRRFNGFMLQDANWFNMSYNNLNDLRSGIIIVNELWVLYNLFHINIYSLKTSKLFIF